MVDNMVTTWLVALVACLIGSHLTTKNLTSHLIAVFECKCKNHNHLSECLSPFAATVGFATVFLVCTRRLSVVVPELRHAMDTMTESYWVVLFIMFIMNFIRGMMLIDRGK